MDTKQGNEAGKLNKYLNVFYKVLVLGSIIAFIFAVIFFFISPVPTARADTFNDFLRYAATQDNKIDEITLPYLQQVAELKKQSLANVQKIEVQNFAKFTKPQNTSNASPLISKNQRYGNTPIIIFVSFSMPKQSLKQWLTQAHHIQAPVVIRGLVNNSFKDTARLVAELVKEHPGGVQIDPTLFKQFSINQVPAVVITADLDSSSANSSAPSRANFDVVYGDVTLEYALKKFIAAEGDRSALARAKLKMLRGAA